MKAIDFKESDKMLQPSGEEYSDNVESVGPLPVWTDGEQCVSCWRMSWQERLSAMLFGRVWCVVLSGLTQPPIYLEAGKDYFEFKPAHFKVVRPT